MKADGMFIAGVACVLFGTVLLMVFLAQWGVYALQRRRGLAAANSTNDYQVFSETWEQTALISVESLRVGLDSVGPADWVWPQFPETLAAKIEEQP